MNDNVLIAIIAACAVIIAAVCVLGGAIFAFVANSKRLDKIERTLEVIQSDLKEFFRFMDRAKDKLQLGGD